MHTSGDDVVPPFQINPASIAQLELHPSPLVVSPSSQVSELVRLLSPQVATHDVFVASGDNPAGQAEHESGDDTDPPLQIKFNSIAHNELHPSPSFVLYPDKSEDDIYSKIKINKLKWMKTYN